MADEQQDSSKKDPTEKEGGGTIDKIIMGAIIGTAIGSAIGMSMAPKKGKEMRKIISKEAEEVGTLTKETTFGFLRLAKKFLGLLFRKLRKQAAARRMKEIPDESESAEHEETRS